jgi:predicted nucleic acid-binding protein
MAQIVISDTSCLILYDKIGRFNILHATFEQVVVTQEVAAEYGTLPDWIEVKSLKNRDLYDGLKLELGKGEASSIAFAVENENTLLIIDERKGRKRAEEFGLSIIGSLGVLLKAKEKGVIPNLLEILKEIDKTDFRISESIKEKLLGEAGEFYL